MIIEQNRSNIDFRFDFTEKNIVSIKSKKEENDTMKMNLGLSGSLRVRANGLMELRYQQNGKSLSVYGRSEEELRRKVNEKKRKSESINRKKVPSLMAFLETWVKNYKEPNLAENSIKALRYCISKHIFSNFDNKSLSRYTTAELDEGLLRIESSRMRQYTRGVISQAFKKATELSIIRKNPAAHLMDVTHKSVKGRALTHPEQEYFLKEIRKRKHYEYFLFLFYSGCRRAEAVNLKWEHVDFAGNKIIIPGTKTNESFRTIPMFSELRKILLSLERKDEKVFHISNAQATAVFHEIMPEHHLHELRHTFATNCIEAGIDAKVLQSWLGHSNISTTMNIYSHVLNEFDERQALKFDEYTQNIPKA